MPSKLGLIWPKDPRRGNPTRWPRIWRLKDVFKNRRPDIFVGRIDKKAPDETNWSRWPRHEVPGACTGAACDGSAECCYRDDDAENQVDTPFSWARRAPEVRYDFRTRRYQVPDAGTWSKVQHCGDERHVVPLRFWDRDGAACSADRSHCLVYRKCGCDC